MSWSYSKVGRASKMAEVVKQKIADTGGCPKGDKIAINRVAQRALLQKIEELEQRAGRLGMLVTMRALNNAKNALGWEMAGDIISAGKAARGVRPRKSR